MYIQVAGQASDGLSIFPGHHRCGQHIFEQRHSEVSHYQLQESKLGKVEKLDLETLRTLPLPAESAAS